MADVHSNVKNYIVGGGAKKKCVGFDHLERSKVRVKAY